MMMGSFPDSLDQLVPDYLDSVPFDPFVDKPLKLSSKHDRIIIYAVDDDMQDDGGDLDGDASMTSDCGIELRRLDHRGIRVVPIETSEE